MDKKNLNQIRIIFRVDGNSQIGLGHIIRSLALAYLIKQDFKCVFIMQEPSDLLIKQTLEVCEELIILPNSNNYNHEANLLIEKYITEEDIIVLDGYNFDTGYQNIIKNNGNKLVCIDDLHGYHFVADVVINHSPGVKAEDYSVEFYTKLYLGLNYLILRKAFINHSLPARNIISINTFLICFGGADPYNLTVKAINALLKVNGVKKVIIVTGSVYPHINELITVITNIKKFDIEHWSNIDSEKLVEKLSHVDVAIVPSSTISLECISIGVIIFTGYFVENQKEIYNGLLANNLANGLSDLKTITEDEIAKKINDYIISYNRTENQISKQRELVDGLSDIRLKQIILEL